MDKKQNEFKFSTLRQFGSENVSFTSTIFSDKQTLSEEEIGGQVNQIGKLIEKAFQATVEREISEKDILIASSARKREAVKKLDDALKLEMETKSNAAITMKKAEKLSDKMTKNN